MNQPPEKTGTDEESIAVDEKIVMPCLFVLFECARPNEPPSRHSLAGVDTIRFGRRKTRKVQHRIEKGTCYLDVCVPDELMSSTHARITLRAGSALLEDGPSKNGCFINRSRQERALLEDGDVLQLGHTFFTFRRLLLDLREDVDVMVPPAAPALATIVPDVHREFAGLADTAKSGVSVLLTGETGTGKELLARALHQLSGRTGEFIAINCGALSTTVLGAELFGVKKGAYTGADRERDGIIRAANGGTLFLDEVGEIPIASQAAFLRFLQERQVVPVGGTHPIGVNFRLVCATNRNLAKQVASGEFREDLLSRISGLVIRVPPLRERREDLPLLVPVLLARYMKASDPPQRFKPRAIQALLSYDWPANIRELENCLEAASVRARGGPIDIDKFPAEIRSVLLSSTCSSPQEAVSSTAGDLSERDQKIRDTLVRLLHERRGIISEVARAMNKERTQIRRWIKRFGLDADKFRDE